jgi:hypothetical protein
MPGNPANQALGTICHYYSPTQTCRVGIVIAVVSPSYTATIRQLDALSGGVPVLTDHANVVMDNELAATDSWHYANVCTNLS